MAFRIITIALNAALFCFYLMKLGEDLFFVQAGMRTLLIHTLFVFVFAASGWLGFKDFQQKRS